MSVDLLLLHGALYTGSEFKPLVDSLSDSFTLHTLDFSGHGTAAMPDEPYSSKLFANDVIRYMDEHEIEKVSIFGFSMGGYVALWLARNHPERVVRVMTLGTKLDWNPETSAAEVTMLDPAKIEEKVPRFAETLKGRHGQDRWREVLTKTAEMMINLGDNPELPYEEFSAIEQPVRLQVGDRDHMVSIEETLRAFRQLPNGELAVLPGTGHPLEKAPVEMLTRVIQNFITE